jgi:hypothetical protein
MSMKHRLGKLELNATYVAVRPAGLHGQDFIFLVLHKFQDSLALPEHEQSKVQNAWFALLTDAELDETIAMLRPLAAQGEGQLPQTH